MLLLQALQLLRELEYLLSLLLHKLLHILAQEQQLLPLLLLPKFF